MSQTSKSSPIILKRAAPTEGVFTGLAAAWSVDRDGERFQPGAFAKSLAEFRARGARIPLLFGHDPSRPIGSVMSAKETADGLEITAELALDTVDGAEAYALLKSGALSMSVGFQIPAGSTKQDGNVRVLTAADLLEISVVPVPANPDAIVQTVKYLSRADLEHAARDKLQLSRSQAKTLAALYWPAYSKTEPEPEVKPKTPSVAAMAALKALNTQLSKGRT